MSDYSIFPRSLLSAGRVRFGKSYGVQRSARTPFGMRNSRATMPKARHSLELSWDGVGIDHLADLNTVIDSTLGGAGLVVTPTFRADTRLTQAYISGTSLYVSDVTPFTTWTITIASGVNDRIDFSEDGSTDRTATLTAASYTPAGLAAHIATQMIAAVSGPQYVVLWDETDDRFSIAEDTVNGTPTGTLELYWFSGTNAGRTVGASLGFDVSQNRTGSTTYKSNFFKAPYGHRVLLGDYSNGYQSTLVRDIQAVDTETNVLTIDGASGHTYPVGSVVEPLFNASIILPEEDGEFIYNQESGRHQHRIVSSSVKLVEEFNA